MKLSDLANFSGVPQSSIFSAMIKLHVKALKLTNEKDKNKVMKYENSQIIENIG